MESKAIDCVKNYLYESTLNSSLFIDIENTRDYNEFVKNIGDIKIKIVKLSSFCLNNDSCPNMENFYNYIENNNENMLVLGFSQYFKFIDEDELLNQISIASSKSLKSKCVFLLFQAKNVLEDICNGDLRFRNRCKIFDGVIDNLAFRIYRNFPKLSNVEQGFKKILERLETNITCEILKFNTALNKKLFERHSYSLIILESFYDCIVEFDKTITSYAKQEFLTSDEWKDVYEQVQKFSTLEECYNNYFGDSNRYKYYNSLNQNGRCKNLYILALREKNELHYINYVANTIERGSEFFKYIYLRLLDIDTQDKNFQSFYNERKNLCLTFNTGENIGFLNDYCKYSMNKGINGIQYLTCNTDIEKKAIIQLISQTNINNNIEIIDMIKNIYPDLSLYLSKYFFNQKNNLLDDYFDEYKHCKVTNRISETMLNMVEQQAKKREYNYILPTRTEIIDKYLLDNDYVIFADAMGAEYLSYILKKCNEYQLMTSIYVARSNLPTLTSFNKDFRYNYSYKKLDDLKHHPEGDYNYEKTKLPIHIPKELELIDEILQMAIDKLSTNKRVAIVSDHGASRLAVIYNSKIIDSGSDGEHGGRCCRVTESTHKLGEMAEDNNYFCMANYDRFKGGRAPEIEVHGGATLEEITVPVIVLTRKDTNIDVRVITKIIKVSYKQKAKLILEASIKLETPYVVINNKKYDCEINNTTMEFTLEDIKKPGNYTALLFDGGNQIGKTLEFTIESKVSSENSLF